MAQADLDGDGNQEILLTGVNNDDNLATAVVLFPMSCLARQAAFTRAQALWTSKDRIVVLVSQGTSDDEHTSSASPRQTASKPATANWKPRACLTTPLSSAEIDKLRQLQVIRRTF
jgi:hypothetical protein